jgi:ATP-binding cassette subfamily B (MDR/TAP) protein 1
VHQTGSSCLHQHLRRLSSGFKHYPDVLVAYLPLFRVCRQIYCWTRAGERQAQKFREQYVNAILAQEVGWFDTCGAGELSTKVTELCGKIQYGMGCKLGDSVQLTAQIVGCFAAAFYQSWRLAAVLIAAIPVVAGIGKHPHIVLTLSCIRLITCASSEWSGAFATTVHSSAENQTMDLYAAAGGVATETLGAIRTVTALNAQPDAITRYRACLFTAMQVGLKKGFELGVGKGGMLFTIFGAYALGIWYGGTLVADSIDSRCTGDHCVNGGTHASPGVPFGNFPLTTCYLINPPELQVKSSQFSTT